METNERMKKAVRAAIQAELERFFAQVQGLSEGDLEHLEEQVVKTSQQWLDAYAQVPSIKLRGNVEGYHVPEGVH